MRLVLAGKSTAPYSLLLSSIDGLLRLDNVENDMERGQHDVDNWQQLLVKTTKAFQIAKRDMENAALLRLLTECVVYTSTASTAKLCTYYRPVYSCCFHFPRSPGCRHVCFLVLCFISSY